MKRKYFYALYNKNDECIGVYDSLEEAIWKVFHVSKKQKNEYRKIYINIHHSFKKRKNNYGNRYSYKGFWYRYFF